MVPTLPAPAPSGTTSRLKAATQPLHDAAERHEFQRQLLQGTLPLTSYIEYLEQMFIVHRCLEGHLRDAAGVHPAFSQVVRDYQYQEKYLREDLAHFGVDPCGIEPLPATAALTETLDGFAVSEPLALLGCHYVVEGSNNGSRFLSRAVRRAYDLTQGGTRYLDPYGDAQRSLWEQFRSDMNALPFTNVEYTALQRGAQAMFEGIHAMQEDLHRSQVAAGMSSAARST